MKCEEEPEFKLIRKHVKINACNLLGGVSLLIPKKTKDHNKPNFEISSFPFPNIHFILQLELFRSIQGNTSYTIIRKLVINNNCKKRNHIRFFIPLKSYTFVIDYHPNICQR